jgi:fructose-bisphosphate aldolase class 1
MYFGFRNEAIKHLGIRTGGKLDKRLHELTTKEHEKFLNYRRRYRSAMVKTLHAMKRYINERMTV